jgi:hypothetical protein
MGEHGELRIPETNPLPLMQRTELEKQASSRASGALTESSTRRLTNTMPGHTLRTYCVVRSARWVSRSNFADFHGAPISMEFETNASHLY